MTTGDWLLRNKENSKEFKNRGLRKQPLPPEIKPSTQLRNTFEICSLHPTKVEIQTSLEKGSFSALNGREICQGDAGWGWKVGNCQGTGESHWKAAF